MSQKIILRKTSSKGPWLDQKPLRCCESVPACVADTLVGELSRYNGLIAHCDLVVMCIQLISNFLSVFFSFFTSLLNPLFCLKDVSILHVSFLPTVVCCGGLIWPTFNLLACQSIVCTHSYLDYLNFKLFQLRDLLTVIRPTWSSLAVEQARKTSALCDNFKVPKQLQQKLLGPDWPYWKTNLHPHVEGTTMTRVLMEVPEWRRKTVKAFNAFGLKSDNIKRFYASMLRTVQTWVW